VADGYALKFISGKYQGGEFPLKADKPVVIGRSSELDMVLVEDMVSRKHAKITWLTGKPHIEDLGSTNGTFVGRERVARRALRPGDLVALGSALLKYLGPDDPESAYLELMARLARQDPLTGLANRAAFDEALAREWGRGGRRPVPVALLLFDVDHFKRVNDGHGHAAGDAVLRDLATLLRGLLRPDALLARVGGEELAVVLPDAGLAEARALGERCRAAVEGHAFGFEGRSLPVTVSAGAAAREEADGGPAALLARADARLYEAKRGGRNQVRG